jgi:aryl-alcohol dehydrogenase-like predicted oxidoreductase
MNLIALGASDLRVSPVCLGTMTFGEQVGEDDAHAILDRARARGVNFLDTAEMYAVPARPETCGATETILGNWFAKHPGVRQNMVLATKVAGPSRGMPWIREGGGMTAADIRASCDASLRRLRTDVIDLYQIHWPERHVPAFGIRSYDPAKEKSATPILEQLQTLGELVQGRQGPTTSVCPTKHPMACTSLCVWPSSMGLPRVVSVQNPYCLINRSYENALG